MLLAIDVGNTHIHLGVFRGDGLAAQGTVSNRRDRTPDELGLLVTRLIETRGVDPGAVDAAVLACVVPPVASKIEKMVRRTFGTAPYVVGPESEPEMMSEFSDPREVGPDRIANAVGGFSRYGGPLIVVDFGTATTFDAISREGHYLGGAIAPGLQISIDALFDRAARLPRIDLVRPGQAVGRDTVSSMQSGIVFGYAGLVEALVGRLSRELGGEAAVVATGGLAPLIVRETGTVSTVDPYLTLDGLRILHGRAAARGEA